MEFQFDQGEGWSGRGRKVKDTGTCRCMDTVSSVLIPLTREEKAKDVRVCVSVRD